MTKGSYASNKRVAGETYNTYYPINFVKFDPNNQVQFQIPASEAVLDFSRSYLSCTLNIPKPASWNDDNLPYYTSATRAVAIGPINAGNIFDQIQLYIGGRVIYDQPFAQTNQRLYELSKSQDYIEWEPNTYLDVNNVQRNITNGLLVEVKAIAASIKFIQFVLKIPMELLCPVFSAVNDWPAFGLTDNLNIMMNTSQLNKYITAVYYDTTTNKVLKVTPILSNGYIAPITTDFVTTGNGNLINIGEDYTLTDLKIVVPCHVPEAKERAKIMNVLNSTGICYGFRTFEISGQSTRDFNKMDTTQELCFNVTKNNIYGVAAIALSQNSEVVFDRPVITNIDCSLNNNYHLDLDTIHSKDNWYSGSGFYQSFLAKNGAFNFKHITRVSDGFIYDNKQAVPKQPPAPTTNPGNASENTSGYEKLLTTNLNASYGSYLMYYNVSPGDSIGISSNLFAHLIVLSMKSSGTQYSNGVYIQPVFAPTQAATPPAAEKTENLDLFDVLGATNHMNTRYYIGVQTLNIMCVKSSDVDIINPSASELLSASSYRDYKLGNTDHGVGAVVGAVANVIPQLGNLIGKPISWISKKVNQGRVKANVGWLYRNYGANKAEEMLKNPGMKIMVTKPFRKFKGDIQAMPHGLMEHNSTYGGYSFDKTSKQEGGTSAFTNDKAANVSNVNLPFGEIYTRMKKRFGNINNSGIKSHRNFRRVRYMQGQNRVIPNNLNMHAAHGCDLVSHGLFSKIKGGIKRIGSHFRDKWNNKWKGDLKNKGKHELEKLKNDVMRNLKEYALKVLENPSYIKQIPQELQGKVKAYAMKNAKRLLEEAKEYAGNEAGDLMDDAKNKLFNPSHGPLTYDNERIKKYYAKYPKAAKRFKYKASHGDLNSLRISILRDKLHRGMKDYRKQLTAHGIPERTGSVSKRVLPNDHMAYWILKNKNRIPSLHNIYHRYKNKMDKLDSEEHGFVHGFVHGGPHGFIHGDNGFKPMKKRNPLENYMGDEHGGFVHGGFVHGN